MPFWAGLVLVMPLSEVGHLIATVDVVPDGLVGLVGLVGAVGLVGLLVSPVPELLLSVPPHAPSVDVAAISASTNRKSDRTRFMVCYLTCI
jgi:hypothetical protein